MKRSLSILLLCFLLSALALPQARATSLASPVMVTAHTAGEISRMSAIQVNLVNIVSEEFAGIGVGLFNDVNSLQGIQAGLFNTVAHDVSGFQIGLFNNADSVSGIQVGLFNRTVSMQGLQIGLINLITEGPITFFPIVNFAY